MNFEKVLFAFFILLALTLNFGFFIGDMSNPSHHNVFELFAALVVSLIATLMKFGDKSHCWNGVGGIQSGGGFTVDSRLSGMGNIGLRDGRRVERIHSGEHCFPVRRRAACKHSLGRHSCRRNNFA